MSRPQADKGANRRAGTDEPAPDRDRPEGGEQRRLSRPALALFAAFGSLAFAHAAHAAGAQCTVTEILASNEKKGVDPGLAKLKGKLTKPPLSSFDTFKLLGDKPMALEWQKSASTPLAYGTLTLLYKDRMAAQGGKARLRFGVDVDDKHGHRQVSTVVVFDSGDEVIIGGQPFQGGTYILALGCQAAP